MTIQEKVSILEKKIKKAEGLFHGVGIKTRGAKKKLRPVQEILNDVSVFLRNQQDIETSNELKDLIDFWQENKQYIGDIFSQFLADVEDCIEMHIKYKNRLFAFSSAPIKYTFSNEENFSDFRQIIHQNLDNILNSLWFHPTLRKHITDKNPNALSFLHTAFNWQSTGVKVANMVVIKRNFPEFYKELTENQEFLTVEELEEQLLSENKDPNV